MAGWGRKAVLGIVTAGALVASGTVPALAAGDRPSSDFWQAPYTDAISTTIASPGETFLLARYPDWNRTWCQSTSEGDMAAPTGGFYVDDVPRIDIAEAVGAGGTSFLFSDYLIFEDLDASTPIELVYRHTCTHTDGTPTETRDILLTIVDEVDPLYATQNQWTWGSDPNVEPGADIELLAMGFRPGESVKATILNEAQSAGWDDNWVTSDPVTVLADNAGAVTVDMVIPADWSEADMESLSMWIHGADSNRFLHTDLVPTAEDIPQIEGLSSAVGPAEGQAYEQGILAVELTGYDPNAEVVMALHAAADSAHAEPIVLGSLTVDATGAGTREFDLPAGVTGEFTLWAGEKVGGHWLRNTPLEIIPAPADAGLTLGTGEATDGQPLVVTGEGFRPGEQVRLTLHSDPVELTTTTAGPDGSFSLTVTLPNGVTGNHEVRATGTQTGLVVRQAVTIEEDTTPTDPPAPPLPARIAGPDRYATAAAIAAVWDQHFDGDTVFIATGENFPDALAAAAAAAELGAPVLLTKKNSLPAAVKSRLNSLRPDRIIVLGSSAAVSNSVVNALKTVAGSPTVERWAGSDRYATASEIIKKTW